MSGTRGGIGRIVAMGIALAVALLLAIVGEARASKYSVAQCGWYVGADADWADTTGGAKFRPDGFCVPPAGSDPFDSARLKSLTRDGQATVSGTRFARWRWAAPAGTGITQVRGTWWHALHDGFEQRLGVGNAGGGFDPFLSAASTDTAPHEFVAGFATPMPAFEDRLLCARVETGSCSLDAPSWSGLRALTITLEDAQSPTAAIGGDLLSPGWRRGSATAIVLGWDVGSGLRFAETTVDGARVAQTEFECAKVSIGGEWRGTRMRPCSLEPWATQTVATTSFSDGPHQVRGCVADFAGNAGCAAAQTVLIDNTAPVHPRSPQLAGGDGWHRTDDFDLSWANPDQAPASPIAGTGWRLTGPGGYDSGPKFAPGRDLSSLGNLAVPGPGAYTLALWLRDEAGNESPASALSLPLRFDDAAPKVAFAGGDGDPQLRASVVDPLSGPGPGSIFYRRAESQSWAELPTKLVPAEAGQAELQAPMPELAPGTWVFRADAADAAGNVASTTLRADGTPMAIRKVAAAEVAKAKTRLFARLRGGHGRGDALTVPFGAPAMVSGRLTRADGAGLGGRELRLVARPSRGAVAPVSTLSVTTGERGGFELRLPPGPSRRVSVSFPGDAGLDAAGRPSLALRVRSGINLQLAPSHLRTGEVLHLSGRVASRGAPVPRRGKLVAIQYLEEATHRWRPVLVTRSDHSGRFRARYRFRYVSGAASIRLRATALAEERWPYAAGSSRPVTVDVSGR